MLDKYGVLDGRQFDDALGSFSFGGREVVLFFFAEVEFGGLNGRLDHASFLHSFDYNYRWNNNYKKEELALGKPADGKMGGDIQGFIDIMGIIFDECKFNYRGNN